MIVAGVQIDTVWEQPVASFRAAEPLIAAAVAGGAQLVVLPEMFATGFSMAAERVAAQGPTARAFLAEQARRHGVWLLGGLAEPGPERPRNAAVLYAPDGAEALCYHKLHPFSLAGEPEHYDAGAALPTAVVAGCRVTVLICYDLRFPEPFRTAAEGTDLFVVIANWPAPRRGHWSALLAARAIENQCYVLGVNRVGEADGLCYTGDSALVDPLGAHIAARSEQPGLVLGAVDPARVAAVRAQFPFLADRRPELYRRLAAGGVTSR